MKVEVIILLAIACSIEAAKYLSEKPSYLNPCSWDDANFEKCMVKNFQVLFTEWKTGVPGLKSVGPIDPLEIKRVKIAQDGNSLISINADLKNMFVKGSSKTVVQSVRMTRDSFEVKVFVPKLRFETDYRIKGRILQLPLNGEGKGSFETEKSIMIFHGKMNTRQAGDHTFMDIQSMTVTIDDIGNFHVELGNLFDGQQDLGAAANTLFNDNWRDMLDVLRPVLEQTVQAVLQDRFKRIFNYVPATYFLSEI